MLLSLLPPAAVARSRAALYSREASRFQENDVSAHITGRFGLN